MNRYFIVLFLAYLLWCPSLPISAETVNGNNVSRLIGIFAPQSGSWSKYAIFDKATGKRTVMRLAIVGSENDSFWYELVDRDETHSSVVKMLIKGDPYFPDNILRVIVKSGSDPARELSGNFRLEGSMIAGRIFEQHSGISSKAGNTLQNVSRGEGNATVPAGTFDVSLYQIIDKTGRVHAEYELSPEVHPFGVVVLETEETTMVLAGYGKGARSLITAEPGKKMGPGLQGGMPSEMTPGMSPGPGSNLRQIPGMGTGYEPKK